MKHNFGTLAMLIGTMAMTIVACGGRQTMASKSAAAYDEAKRKGIPVAAGEHGGHTNEAAAGTDQTAMPGMDHSTMPAMDHATPAMDHATPAMDHSSMPEMDHSTMNAAKHAQMSGVNHSTMPGMDNAKMPATDHANMPGMDHSSMAGMDHSQMAGMRHGQPAESGHSMAGMQHGLSPAPAAVVVPASNSEIAKLQPAATLHADEFDAPAPDAIAESAKGASGMSHSMEGAPAQHQHSSQPRPPSEHQHHNQGAS